VYEWLSKNHPKLLESYDPLQKLYEGSEKDGFKPLHGISSK
jgi:hypothetical protein